MKEVNFMKKIKKILKNSEDGVTAIEYGLIASGIALAIVAVVFGIGIQLNILLGMTVSR